MAVTITEEKFSNAVQILKKIVFDWVSVADGTASGVTTNAYTGEIVRLVTIPDGVDAPSDNYDITINDEDSTDVLVGAGANRSTSATQQVLASSLGCVANDKLTISITSAGNVKKGKAIVYIR